MGAKTKTVGGGSATPVAQDFTKFLGEGLTSGNFGGYETPGQTVPKGAFDYIKYAAAEKRGGRTPMKPGQVSAGHAVDTTTGMAGVLNSMLGMGGGGQQGNTKFGEMFSAGAGAGGAGGMMTPNNDPLGIGKWIQDEMAMRQPGSTSLFDNEAAAGIQGVLQNQQGRDVAELRARYGMMGSGVGSGAGTSEAVYRAEAAPQSAMALGQLHNQLRALQQQDQQLSQNLAGMGMNYGQMQAGNQQQILGMLFNAMNQINAMGTPQAQTVQQPGMLGQIAGAAGGLLGLANPISQAMGGWGNVGQMLGMGGGGGIPQIPNISIPNINIPQVQLPQPWRVGG